MGSEAEAEATYTPKLSLFSSPKAPPPHMNSPERSGMLTPPLYSSAAVPFRWEEEPGKPRGSATATSSMNTLNFSQKCLDLPPRLLFIEGPYEGNSKVKSSSFRMIRKDRFGSSRRSFSPESCRLSAVVLSKKGVKDRRGFWCKWGWGRKGLKGKVSSKREVSWGSYVIPSFANREANGGNEEEDGSKRSKVKVTKIKRADSFSTLSYSRPQFWATIYEGLKQVVPWRSKKPKKDRAVI